MNELEKDEEFHCVVTNVPQFDPRYFWARQILFQTFPEKGNVCWL